MPPPSPRKSILFFQNAPIMSSIFSTFLLIIKWYFDPKRCHKCSNKTPSQTRKIFPQNATRTANIISTFLANNQKVPQRLKYPTPPSRHASNIEDFYDGLGRQSIVILIPKGNLVVVIILRGGGEYPQNNTRILWAKMP